MTGVPAQVIRELAHAYARADRAILCWTLGITEHVTAVDNVLSLINLALLTGHVGPLRLGAEPAARPEQRPGRRRHGRDPQQAARLPGRPGRHRGARPLRGGVGHEARRPSAAGTSRRCSTAMERGELRTLYVMGENPAQSEADSKRALELLEGLDFLIAQDILMTKTCEMADVVLPSSASWCEADGGHGHEQRAARAAHAQGARPAGRGPRRPAGSSASSRGASATTGDSRRPRRSWDELRSLSPMHRGMSYERLEELGGIQWPCPSEDHPGSPFLHGRLWAEPARRASSAPFSVTPVGAAGRRARRRLPDPPDHRPAPGLLQHRRAVGPLQLAAAPRRDPRPLSRRTPTALERRARRGRRSVTSRRGSIEAPVRLDSGLRPGLAFMTLHFPDEVDVNMLTIDATDPKSGTAEFKATAVRVEKVDGASARLPAW